MLSARIGQVGWRWRVPKGNRVAKVSITISRFFERDAFGFRRYLDVVPGHCTREGQSLVVVFPELHLVTDRIPVDDLVIVVVRDFGCLYCQIKGILAPGRPALFLFGRLFCRRLSRLRLPSCRGLIPSRLQLFRPRRSISCCRRPRFFLPSSFRWAMSSLRQSAWVPSRWETSAA